MNTTVISKQARKRIFSPALLISGVMLGIRSRWGFNILMACSRVLGFLITYVRFLINPAELSWVSRAVLWAGLFYALLVLVVTIYTMNRLDKPVYYGFLIFVDAILISYYVFVTDHVSTDLYLLYFLPLMTAAHFFERRKLIFLGPAIVLLYLFVLIFEPYDNLVVDILVPWLGRASFLILGAIIFRTQRSLPNINESWVVAPRKARDKLEKQLKELSAIVPYDTASIQLVYRDRLLIVACEGFPNRDEIYQIEFPVDDKRYPNEYVINNKKTKIAPSENYPSFKDEHYFAGHIKSWMGVPLISPATGECFGMISIDSSKLNAYAQLDAMQAGWFAQTISSFLVDAALGPAALTQATNRENLIGLLKSWSSLLPGKTSKWDDDIQAVRELASTGQKIFRTEDCSIFFLRHKFENNREKPVLHLIASTSVPPHNFQKHEMNVTGQHGDGLTGLTVHRNRTLNYGAYKVEHSPYRAHFTYHLNFLFSKRSRQVMITPLRDSKGNAVGAIKIENRMGTSSEKEFYPVEKNLFEIYAAMVSLILETIRQRNYINRLDGGIHGVRGIIHHAAVDPIERLFDTLPQTGDGESLAGRIREIHHTLEYVKMTIHGILSDSEDNLYLEKEGLIHAIHNYLKSLKDIPSFKRTCELIRINGNYVRDDEMPYHIREIFFNVAKEGILNIVRHSRISEKPDGCGEVLLSRFEGAFILSIRDNGIGFVEEKDEENQKHSFGLNDVKKQMEFVKYHSKLAEMDIESQPGHGTQVQAKWAP